MITYLELEALVLSGVGLDGSAGQRYLRDQDLIPGTNSAISRGTAAGNYAMAQWKGSEEMLRELQEDRVFQSNAYGGIALENTTPALGHNVWSILSIIAEPITLPSNPTILPLPQTTYNRTDVVTRRPGLPVKRITKEVDAKTVNNPSLDGNETLAATPARTYAYILNGKRTNTSTIITGDYEILIRPSTISGQKLFNVTYLRQPATITSAADTIDFPNSMLRLLADWVIEYLAAFKQGKNSAILQSVQQDAQRMFNQQVS